jgi:hypothetical protein
MIRTATHPLTFRTREEKAAYMERGSGPQALPELRRAPHVQRSRASRRSRLAQRARQAVGLSLPWEFRGLAATRPGVLGAMDRLFAEEIARVTKRLARSIEGAETGSVAGLQRFGGAQAVGSDRRRRCVHGRGVEALRASVRASIVPSPSAGSSSILRS